MTEQVRLHGMAYGGSAVGRLPDGLAVFVPRGLPGELVSVEIVARKRSFARGRLIDVLEPAPARIAPPCRHFEAGCGGCQWQQASYGAQLPYKQAVLAGQLQHAGLDVPSLDPIPSPAPFEYRNTAVLHLSGGRLGFLREGSGELLDIKNCPLLEPPLNAALRVIRQGRTNLRGVTAVHLRAGVDALQVGLMCDTDPRELKVVAAELAAAVQQAAGMATRVAGVRSGSNRMRGLCGEPWVHVRLAGRLFRVSVLSFFQVNTGVAEVLADLVKAHVREGMRVLDLYCGVGTFGLLMADAAGEVVGVEAHPPALADAAANRAETAADNARFVEGDAAAMAPLAAEGWDLAVLDPPRAGAARQVLESLAAGRVVYVSCDPSTLARDLKLLTARGYRVTSVQLLDMFPQTYHIETVTVLERTRTSSV